MKKADVTYENGALILSGELDFFNVMSVYQKSLELIRHKQPESFDLTQLKDTNSAIVALMIEWVKLAYGKQYKIVFRGVSEDVKALIKASNLAVITAIDV